ncbi:MAG: response regulator [Candidatus Roseilinea sp.]|nr:MAG: response regulator [Candidatus Roseilinea sp.]
MATILVVEDHLVTQLVLSKRLRNSGYTVVTASSGREALAYLAQSPVDLIISDISMPEIDGLNLLRCMRVDESLRDVPVIILTNSVLDQHRLEASAAGADGFLEKPVSSWELEATVKRLLSRKHAHDSRGLSANSHQERTGAL